MENIKIEDREVYLVLRPNDLIEKLSINQDVYKRQDHLFNYFKSISQIKEVKFRKSNFSFLEEDFDVIMCHYHMINWNRKHYGSVEICGHSHGRLDDYNLESPDLRVDVGIDGKLANYELISLEKLYNFFKEKAEGKLFADYAREKKNENMLI